MRLRRGHLITMSALAVLGLITGCGGGGGPVVGGLFGLPAGLLPTTSTDATVTVPPDVGVGDLSGPSPVLGRADNEYAVGYGTERPAVLSLNSLCANTISNIRWTSWGDDTASGTGDLCAPAGDPTSGGPVQLTAADLGECAGIRAYRQLVIADHSTLDVCS
jgi:hypothetical protein